MYLLLIFFPCCSLFASEVMLDLGSIGRVRYTYDENKLVQVERITPSNEVLYSHGYRYNENGQLIAERLIGNLGEIVYETGNLSIAYINNQVDQSSVDAAPVYDEKGRTVHCNHREFVYDEKDRLVEVISPEFYVTYTYDEKDRRVARSVNGDREYFLYFGTSEYAILDASGEVKELRIPGLSFHEGVLRPISIETRDGIYAPIHDFMGHVVKLVNIHTKEEHDLPNPDPFGKHLQSTTKTSWTFSGKHYDPITNLVYFGHRYYSPELAMWLTPDPLQQSNNPYEYCLGKPLFYFDPDGRFAFALPFLEIAYGARLTISSPIWGPAVLATAVTAAAVYTGAKLYQHYNQVERKKEGGVDPTLPTDPFNYPDWVDISNPEAKSNGHHTFVNPKTGETILYDEAKPDEPGHKGHNHYHRPNPNKTGKKDWYLDAEGNPVPKNHEDSHLYPPEWKWWD